MKVILFLLLPFTVSFLYSQQPIKRNAVYIEAGGSGLFGSVNYQRQLTDHYGLALRAGIGFYTENKFYLSIPVAVDYLFALKNKNAFIDCSFGATLATRNISVKKNTITSEGFLNFVPVVGYRKHYNKNILARFNFSPIINNTGFYPWIGVSLGKQF